MPVRLAAFLLAVESSQGLLTAPRNPLPRNLTRKSFYTSRVIFSFYMCPIPTTAAWTWGLYFWLWTGIHSATLRRSEAAGELGPRAEESGVCSLPFLGASTVTCKGPTDRDSIGKAVREATASSLPVESPKCSFVSFPSSPPPPLPPLH